MNVALSILSPKTAPINASKHSLLCQLLTPNQNSKINLYVISNTENVTESSKGDQSLNICCIVTLLMLQFSSK